MGRSVPATHIATTVLVRYIIVFRVTRLKSFATTIRDHDNLFVFVRWQQFDEDSTITVRLVFVVCV